MRVLIISLIPLALGLGIVMAYVDLMFSDAKFLSGVHEARMGATKIMLPGWIHACVPFSLDPFLLYSALYL